MSLKQLLLSIPSIALLLISSMTAYAQMPPAIVLNDDLKLYQASPKVFMHVSDLKLENGEEIECNGLVYVSKGEAMIIDCPVNDTLSKDLIYWITNTLKVSIKSVIVTHFHNDCLGGLREFHRAGIPSYAEFKTINRAKKKGYEVPKEGFNLSLTLGLGGEAVTARFFGQGHTEDNIVCYLHGEKILFGGCLIKAQGAGKGNLEDAVPSEWTATVKRIIRAYKDIKLVIPGHGLPGSIQLLSYTADLFSEDAEE